MRSTWSLAILLLAVAAVASGAGIPPTPGEPAVVAVRPGSRARVRAGPGIDHPVIIRAPAGTEVRVLELRPAEPHPWARVEASDGRFVGWVRADLLEGRPSPSPPTEQAGSRPAREPPAWLPVLRTHLRAVDICLAATTKRPAAVVRVSPLPFEMVSVVVQDGSGRLWDCVVETGGGAPLRYDPLPPADLLFRRPPDPLFYRGDTPPTGSCYELEPVRDAARDTVLGMLVHRRCR